MKLLSTSKIPKYNWTLKPISNTKISTYKNDDTYKLTCTIQSNFNNDYLNCTKPFISTTKNLNIYYKNKLGNKMPTIIQDSDENILSFDLINSQDTKKLNHFILKKQLIH